MLKSFHGFRSNKEIFFILPTFEKEADFKKRTFLVIIEATL